MPSNPSPPRFDQLDALRGIAALSVAIYHIFPLLLKGSPLENTFNTLGYTPINIFWAGHEAVIVFFVLSGVALTIMLQRQMPYTSFALRRIVRLYFPYLIAVLISAALKASLYGNLPTFNDWINQFWTSKPDFSNLIQHIFMIGTFDTDSLDFAVWSLVHEMRISLIFPLLLLLFKHAGTVRSLTILLALSAIAQILQLVTTDLIVKDWTATLGYLLPFGVGIALVREQNSLSKWIQDGRHRSTAAVIIGFFILSYAFRIMNHTPISTWQIVADWPLVLGAALVVGILMVSKKAADTMRRPAFLWLGSISYSLYLWHPIVLLTVLHSFGELLPLPLVPPVVLILTLCVAWIAWRVTEVPSISLSRAIGRPRQPLESGSHMP
ncbi:acyltransferase [Deinococcus sp. LM3]|uniref:acyltransferase family protein n=1 Tax=Deinococcus sp. LM3 TaxID=1938608 RepID=UPI0009937A61|nr:acyltransferase [Deinococcus sp. LM3]OOV11362.1 hypothetical protein BXU09_20055 [Deinococcus sp. LM3]